MSERIAENMGSAVFKINTSSGTGTSFYLKDRDLFVTNFHVIQGHREVAIEDRGHERFPAKVVFVNPRADLAFLQATLNLKRPQGSLSRFAQVQNRERVMVLGFPFGMPYTETEGIVSSARQLMDGRYYIQTDAAVNPGNSGGPVVNKEGQLVGITTSKFTDADNMGFAIPVEVLEEELESFKLNKTGAYSVKCNSCKSLIFEKTEYCGNCGNTIDTVVFDQVTPTKIASFIEEALNFMGLDPVLARSGQDDWDFYYGNTLVTIYFFNREYLYTMSPLAELPSTHLEKLYKYLLTMPIPTYKLGIMDNKIFLSYRIHMSDIFSSFAPKIRKDLAIFPLKSEELSRFFIEKFGCKLTHYSRAERVKKEVGNESACSSD